MTNIFGNKYYFVVMHLFIMLVIILIFSNLLSIFADKEKRLVLFGPETDSAGSGQDSPASYSIKSYFLYILVIAMLVIAIAEVFLRLISRKINNLSS